MKLTSCLLPRASLFYKLQDMAVTEKPKVLKLEEILGNHGQNTSNFAENKQTPRKTTNKTKMKKVPEIVVPKGKPKSGRIWKNERKKFSSIIKTKGIRISFEKKQALRQELARIKEVSRAAKEAKAAEKEAKKERRRENLKRQEENRKKSEIVQVIKNSNKIKKMKKKQLRLIEKRDTTAIEKK